MFPGLCYECGIQATIKCLQCVVLFCNICYTKVYYLVNNYDFLNILLFAFVGIYYYIFINSEEMTLYNIK